MLYGSTVVGGYSVSVAGAHSLRAFGGARCLSTAAASKRSERREVASHTRWTDASLGKTSVLAENFILTTLEGGNEIHPPMNGKDLERNV
uniref:Putative metalloprotease n=1 Tax=Ixodes ricinus TaxID=34613 RepID=A0A0K8RL64_IXORI